MWALNGQHLDLLAAWIGASLRERAPHAAGMTMMARLPRWMKAAANRETVMHGIAQLRARLEAAGAA